MSDWCIADGQVSERAGGTNYAVNIAGHATLNTKGSWTQLIASTARDTSAILASFLIEDSDFDALLDLGIGAAASEVVIVPDLLITSTTNRVSRQVWIPIYIPAGTRVAARVQTNPGAKRVHTCLILMATAFAFPANPASLVTAYGVNAADSGAVSVDPGAVSDTFGAYTEIAASTTYPIRYLILAMGTNMDFAGASSYWHYEIAIGAAAAEQLLVGGIVIRLSDGNLTAGPQLWGPFPVSVPAGTRLSVRGKSQTTSATDRLHDIALYGIS